MTKCTGYCGMCPFRICAQMKKVTRCRSCGDFESCKKVKDFEKQSGLQLNELP